MPENKATATEVAKEVDEIDFQLRSIEACNFNDAFYNCRCIFQARRILAQNHCRLSEENKAMNKEAIECYNQMIRETFFL